jgi:hypothetical protein
MSTLDPFVEQEKAGPSRSRPSLRRNASSSSSYNDPSRPHQSHSRSDYEHQYDSNVNRHNLSPVGSYDYTRSPSSSPSSRRFPPISPTSSYPSTSNRKGIGISRLWRMVSKYLPPGVRRVFTNAPLIGITVGLLVITALYILSAFEQGVLRLRPSSWRPGGYGYPPDVEVVPIQDPSTPNMEAPTPFVLQDLPIEYTPHFPTLQLPSDLLTSPHFHPLATRLHTFLNRPIRTYDEAMRVNEEGCPRRLNDKLVNPDQYRGELAFWEKVSVVDIVERRSQVVKWMGAWAEREGARGLAGGDGMGKGRGIVLTGGNQVCWAETTIARSILICL